MPTAHDPLDHPPDPRDPAALTDWIDDLEQWASRTHTRQQLVLAAARAQHELDLATLRPLPTWATPTDRHRAWALLILGLVLLAACSILTSPAALAAVAGAALAWAFTAAAETARYLTTRARLRTARDQALAEARAARDRAHARLDLHDQTTPTDPGPPGRR